MKLRILGAGGHAKVAAEAWRSGSGEVAAFHDDDVRRHGTTMLGAPVAGPLCEAEASEDHLHVAIGDNRARARIAAAIDDTRCPDVIHARAWVSPTARLSAGILVCAGAVIQPEAVLGRHVIVNSQALVEHDSTIGDFVHVAPGVRLGGGVSIGEGALMGIGSVVLPGVSIGAWAVVGAGAVVIRDVPEGFVVVGNPARPARRG